MSDDRPELLTSTESGVGTVRLNRPAKHNAITFDMWRGIGEAVDAFTNDDEVRVVVVTGEGGRAFSSGADISQFEKQRTSPDAVEVYNRTLGESCQKLTDIPKPTLARIHGFCMGGGLATTLCCDLRIATHDSVFAIPAAKLGVGYAYNSLQTLTRLVGPASAKEIMFTGRRFSADEAYHMGLINRVVQPDEIDSVTSEYTEMLAANAPLTIRACKRIIAELGMDSGERDVEACDQLVDDCFTSEDYKEGRRAFLEKRLPKFRGQ
jgi:enoyl-CoA hydratase